MRFFALLMLALLTCSATSSPEQRSLAEIRKQYARLAKAFAARDTTAILALRTPDFRVETPDGMRHDFAYMQAVLRQFFVLNESPIWVRYTIKQAEFPAPDSAVLSCFQEASRYQMLAGKRRRVVHDVTQRESWVRRKGSWKIRSVGGIRDQHRWIDGKQIDPSKPFDPDAPPFSNVRK